MRIKGDDVCTISPDADANIKGTDTDVDDDTEADADDDDAVTGIDGDTDTDLDVGDMQCDEITGPEGYLFSYAQNQMCLDVGGMIRIADDCVYCATPEEM